MATPSKRRRLELEEVGDVTVVKFVDKKILDEQNIQIIGEQLFDLVDNQGKKKVLLNFGNVEFLCSAAIGKLITMNKNVQNAGGKMVRCKIAREVHEDLEITKLDKLFKIYKDEEAALQAF